ncbi:MAG: hypothetical protein P8L98_01305 [Planctomycetota bacterium]|nr:hypothetical protein [Planctomycetota bacterium]
MFKFGKNPSKPDRLLVYSSSRKSQKLELPHGTLSDVLDAVFAAHPQSAQSLWTISSLLTTNLLKDVVFTDLEGIKNLYLRPVPHGDYALEIQVDITAGKVGEFADAAYQSLLGAQQETKPKAEPISTVEEDVPQAEVEVNIEAEVEVELSTPSARAETPGRRWQQSDDDIFGLAGEFHPDDEVGHGLEIRTQDLPWLNPGDSIISPRRGPCRIKKVDDEQRQVLVRDESKNMLMIVFDELLAEFEFDDDA